MVFVVPVIVRAIKDEVTVPAVFKNDPPQVHTQSVLEVVVPDEMVMSEVVVTSHDAEFEITPEKPLLTLNE
jgi:hypothetical protein